MMKIDKILMLHKALRQVERDLRSTMQDQVDRLKERLRSEEEKTWFANWDNRKLLKLCKFITIANHI